MNKSDSLNSLWEMSVIGNFGRDIVMVRDYIESSQQVEVLCQLVQNSGTDKEIVGNMKIIVPEFISQNSIY